MPDQPQNLSGNEVTRFLQSLTSHSDLDQRLIEKLVQLASAGDLKRDPISRALKSLRAQASDHETQ